MSTRHGIRFFFVVLALMAFTVRPAFAQGFGIDTTNTLFYQLGLYTPHINNCSASESFIAVQGSVLGFCMENSESSAADWDDARKACADAGKRLPEAAEYRTACRIAGSTSLTNMTDDWEWASNSLFFVKTGSTEGLGAAIGGSSSCNALGYAEVGDSSPGTNSLVYRCVH